MNEPKESDKREVVGESGMTYNEVIVPDPERGGVTTAVVPSNDVFVRPSQGE